MIPPTENIKVTVAGRECQLRYPISSLKAIEQELGHSILKLANQASDADISIASLEAVLFYGLRGADDSLSQKEVESLIESDYMGALQAFTAAITKALGADSESDNTADDEATETPGE